MNVDMSIWSLFANASLVVQLVMLILLAASIAAWTLIVQKQRQFKASRAAAERFEQRFWSGIDLVELYKQLAKRRDELEGCAAVFESGFHEFAKLRKQGGIEPMDMVEGAGRAMRVALRREVERLESRLAFLASVGSTSPYIGLFGTVWGIMNSFRALGGSQHATLSMVAPGIAEALIATAMGLFAAIPAVLAYNRFATLVDRLEGQYENFQEEFSTLLQRQAHNRGE